MHFGQIPRVPGARSSADDPVYRADTNPAKPTSASASTRTPGPDADPRAVKLAEQRSCTVSRPRATSAATATPSSVPSCCVRCAWQPRHGPSASSAAAPVRRAAPVRAWPASSSPNARGAHLAERSDTADPRNPVRRRRLRVQHYPTSVPTTARCVDGMLATLQQVPPGDVGAAARLLPQPTGFDLNHDDWLRVLDVVRARELLPLFDFAYRGFGDGLEEDALGRTAVRRNAAGDAHHQFLLEELRPLPRAYRRVDRRHQRCRAPARCAQPARVAGPQPLVDATGPRRRGGGDDPADEPLRQIWQDEVERMRRRIANLRRGWSSADALWAGRALRAHRPAAGMFSYTGLTAEQVRRLRAEDSVYLVESGRANVAGLDAERTDDLAGPLRGWCRPERCEGARR